MPLSLQARSTTQKHLSESLDSLFGDLRAGRSGEGGSGTPRGGGGGGGGGGSTDAITNEDMRRCFFGDFMDTEAEEPAQRKYGEVTDVPL